METVWGVGVLASTCDTIQGVNTYLNTTVECFIPGYHIPQTGFVVDEKPGKIVVRIEHGKFHAQEFEVDISDIIDKSFDEYEVDDERYHAWYDEE